MVESDSLHHQSSSHQGTYMSSETTRPSSAVALLKSRIESRAARVGVIGMGYVGLPLALLFSEQKFAVTGFDIDQQKVAFLEAGGSYIYRIPATEIQAARSNGFTATANYARIGGRS